MTRDRTSELPLEEIIDRCLDEIAAGELTVEGALDRYPDQRAELAPLLETAFAVRDLPRVEERAPDPDRRAAFMASIATTPQDAAPVEAARGLGGWFAGLTSSLPRIATLAAPATAIALVAFFFVLSTGGDRAAASTLTVFEGAIERQQDGAWLTLEDGALLNEGDRLRTTADGQVLLTFADGSTAALAPDTEVVLEEIETGSTRRITLEQLAGRIWNDVAPGAAPATYIVRTPDAVVEAHGTTFETVVIGGETSVTNASGLVEVTAGDDAAMVEPGAVLRASAQRIVDTVLHPTLDAPAVLTVRGPFVASLRAPNDAATGALPNGVTYQQIPGVSTTNPGDGPQVMRFYDIAPGRYVLVFRRIGEPLVPGMATLETGGRERGVELPSGLATMRVRLDIGVNGNIVSLELVDAEPLETGPQLTDERIVETDRTTDAVAVSDQRAASGQTRPADATRSPATPSDAASPTPEVDRTPTATVAPRDRLLAALDLDSPERGQELRRLLESYGRDQANWQKLRQRLEGDPALRGRFVEALGELNAPLFVAFVREQLGFPTTDRADDPSVDPTAEATRPSDIAPVATATPADSPTRPTD